MKKVIFLIIIIMTFYIIGCGKKTPDASVFFEPRNYGGSMYDSVRDVTVTAKGLFFSGITNSSGTGDINAWAGMIGYDGKIIWENTFGESGDDRFYSAAVMGSGLLAAAGYINYLNQNGQDAMLVFFSDTGKVVAVRNFGGNGTEDIRGMAVCRDGGIVLCGSSDSYSSVPGKIEGYIVKVDGAGKMQWSTTYGTALKNLIFNSIIETEAGYAAVGRVLENKGGTKGILAFLDGGGKFIWEKRFGDKGFNSFNCITKSKDGYMISGEFDTGSRENTVDAWLVNTGMDGSFKWDKKFGWINPDRFDRVILTDDGGVIAAGITESYGNGSSDIYIVRTDALGNSLWAKYFGGRKDEYLGNLLRVGKNGYIAGGWSASYGRGEYDAWFVGFKEN